MLQIDKVEAIEGVQVYGDDESFSTFYLLPETPRYRRDTNGMPIFKFLKYRLPVDRPDGKKGGGFLIFDAEFVVDEEKMPAIRERLEAKIAQSAGQLGIPTPPLTLGPISYLDGEAKLNFLNSAGVLVSQVFNPAKPSLIGTNITPFSVELTPEGATLAEQALQGLGGIVQVSYKLVFWAKLPPLAIHAYFNSTKFYSFFQTIDVEWRFWQEDDYRETVREQMITSESMVVDVDQGGASAELRDEMSDWAFRMLEKRIEQKMIAELVPVPEDQRKLPDGIENVTRDISSTSITSFTVDITQRATEEWDIYPQGTLPNITSIKRPDGTAIVWEDFADEVDLDDPFFKQLRVDVRVNADFEKLPIHSVEVKVLYKGKPMPALDEGPEGEAVFSTADALAKFATFVKADDFSYVYSYQVNYEGTSRTYESEPVTTDEGTITVGVDDVGILLVDIAPGDINWTDVKSAQVRFTYEDPEADVAPIEEQFVLTQAQPTAQVKEVIFKPFRKAYKYQVKYFMQDGREYQTAEQEGRSHNLFINDPFTGRKTVKVIGVGDFDNSIDNVFVDLDYADETNKYTQEKSVVINKDTRFFDWAFPVVDDSLGVVKYAGNVVLRNGTTQPIAEATSDSGTILVPRAPVASLEVEIVTDLIDFTAVKLIRVSLNYVDDANLATVTEDRVFSAQNNKSQKVRFAIFDAAKKSYGWQVQYFMADNSRKEATGSDVTDTVLVLEVPT